MFVKDKYRKHPLSFEPGGHNVHVVFDDGFEQIYDKVKFPDKFIAKIKDSNRSGRRIANVFVDGKSFKLQ